MSGRDITIMGDGSIAGGQYKQIKIMGNGRVVDYVEAYSIKVMGNGELEDVKAEEIKVSGNARFSGNIAGGELRVYGSVHVQGDIKNKSISINGELKAKNIETEEFVSRGAFRAETLNANDVRVLVGWGSRVKEIGAENVSVSGKGFWGVVHSIFGHHGGRFAVDTIEADRIYLERTHAKSVKGNEVTIGPGCRVDLVEFKDSVIVDKDARVEKTVQI